MIGIPPLALQARRHTAGLRLALLVAAIGLSGCQESLYSGLSESEANQMRQALLQKGISADRTLGEDGRHVLRVDRDDVGAALRTLEAAGLPRQRFASTMDVLKTDALVASPAEDRARLGYALSQELAATIASIDGVISARVHLVMPERAVLGPGKTSPSSASVFVKHRPGFHMAQVSLSVQQLVARSVDGLSPDRVSVVMLTAEPTPQPTAAAVAPGWPPALVGLLALVCVLGGAVAGWWARHWDSTAVARLWLRMRNRLSPVKAG